MVIGYWGGSICQVLMTLHTVPKIAQGLKDGMRREHRSTFQGLVRLRNGAPNLVMVLLLQLRASKLLFGFRFSFLVQLTVLDSPRK